jgi:hypothetical protein
MLKTMNPTRTIKSPMIAVLVLAITTSLQAQISPAGLQEVPRESVPRVGTFWLAKGPTGDGRMAPLPCPPGDLDVPIYALENGQFLVDDTEVDYDAMRSLSASFSSFGFSQDSPDVAPVRNYEKFAAQVFSIIDTNGAATGDTNLYNACLGFPNDTNIFPTLQIERYGTNAVIIKANHFDYSAETRDFALVVSDAVDKPLFKAIDLSGASDAQDGWLVQGSMPNWEVGDAMFMEVSNVNLGYNEFFRAIPYGGPQVVLQGASNYDTVSNTITLPVVLTDLSGTVTTNQRLVVTVNGLSARYALGASNVLSLDTRYASSGLEEIEATFGSAPLATGLQTLPLDTKAEYDTTATLSLDFENSAFLVNSSDMCSPDIGTNYILFGLSQADYIEAVISDPTTGRILASFAGSIPYAATVVIPWNFTESDGTTPYTNDTYKVHFVAYDPTTLDVTNKIDRQGVRSGAGTIITYVEEPANTPTGSFLNGQSDTWIQQTLAYLYNDIYDPWGLTEYYTYGSGEYDVGYGRDITAGYINTPTPANGWRQFLQEKFGSLLYSDATIGPAHGSPTTFGQNGGDLASSRDIASWTAAAGSNWRMRKVAMWTCQSGANGTVLTNTAYPTFAQAFGIRSKALQDSTFMRKNAGLFWAGHIDQGWYKSTGAAQACAEAEESFDQLWVTGPDSYPGGSTPTYAMYKALSSTLRAYSTLQKYGPVLVGYFWLPYSDSYDYELMGNNTSHVR